MFSEGRLSSSLVSRVERKEGTGKACLGGAQWFEKKEPGASAHLAIRILTYYPGEVGCMPDEDPITYHTVVSETEGVIRTYGAL